MAYRVEDQEHQVLDTTKLAETKSGRPKSGADGFRHT
jgi:hypothetical protein